MTIDSTMFSQAFVSLVLLLIPSGLQDPETSEIEKTNDVHKTAESAIREFTRSHNEGDWISFSAILSDKECLRLVETAAVRAGLHRESEPSIRFFTALEENLKSHLINEEDVSGIFGVREKGLEAFSSFGKKRELTAAVVSAFYHSMDSKPYYYMKRKTLKVEKQRAYVDIGIRVSPGIMVIGNPNFPLGESKGFRIYLIQIKPNHWMIGTHAEWSKAKE